MRLLGQRPRAPYESPRGDESGRAELNALHETAMLVAERHGVSELMPLILARVAALVDVEDGFLYLVQPDRESLSIVAGTGWFASHVGRSLNVGEGLAGHVARAGDALTMADYSRWEGRSDQLGPSTFRGAVAVPLRGSNRSWE